MARTKKAYTPAEFPIAIRKQVAQIRERAKKRSAKILQEAEAQAKVLEIAAKVFEEHASDKTLWPIGVTAPRSGRKKAPARN